MWRPNLASVLLLATSVNAQRYDGQFWPCNPLFNATGACPPNPGLPTSTYTIDFTKQQTIPDNWTISNYATVNFGALGAEFTFNKRYDAPQLWTDFFILFGKVTVVAQVANGTGMISSAVLVSDVFDEIDFEMSGNNFGHSEWAAGKGQNNYFGKGITGNYDRGSYFDISNPQGSFHTYTFDWTPTRLNWLVDGKVVRTHLANGSDTTTHQYPQTPSKFQLGIWAGGDPSSNTGTRDWAGGWTDMNGGPYTMYVKSVTIENAMPAWAYNYTDQSGRWQSIALLQDPLAVSASTGPTSSSTTSTLKPSTASTAVSVSKSSTASPPTSTTKPSTTTSTGPAAALTTLSKIPVSTVAPSSTSKTSTAASSPGTVKSTSSSNQLTSTAFLFASTSSSIQGSTSSSAFDPSVIEIMKMPGATGQTSSTNRSSTTTTGKFVYSYTTTTKPCTTSTTAKPLAYKMKAVSTSTAAWRWNGWSNQWHGRAHHGHGH